MKEKTHRIQALVHEVEAQVTVLKEDPGAVLHGGGDEAPGVHLLTLPHGDVPTLDVLLLGQGHDVLRGVRTHG